MSCKKKDQNCEVPALPLDIVESNSVVGLTDGADRQGLFSNWQDAMLRYRPL